MTTLFCDYWNYMPLHRGYKGLINYLFVTLKTVIEFHQPLDSFFWLNFRIFIHQLHQRIIGSKCKKKHKN